MSLHSERAERAMLHYEHSLSLEKWPHGDRSENLARLLAEAQVHATLAVAHELRAFGLSYVEANS